MPNSLDANSTDQDTNLVTLDETIPVDIDGEPIVWDNLKATIAGTLHQVAEWCETTGYLMSFLRHYAVPTAKGVIFDSKESFAFYNGNFVYEHDADCLLYTSDAADE